MDVCESGSCPQVLVWQDIKYKLSAVIRHTGPKGVRCVAFDLRYLDTDGWEEIQGTINEDGCGSIRTWGGKPLTMCGFDHLHRLNQAMLRTWSKAREMLSANPQGYR